MLWSYNLVHDLFVGMLLVRDAEYIASRVDKFPSLQGPVLVSKMDGVEEVRSLIGSMNSSRCFEEK